MKKTENYVIVSPSLKTNIGDMQNPIALKERGCAGLAALKERGCAALAALKERGCAGLAASKNCAARSPKQKPNA